MIYLDTRHYCDMLFAAHASITKLAYPDLRMGRKFYPIPDCPPCYGPYSPVTVLKNCMLCRNERMSFNLGRFSKTRLEMMR
jgi:hypothetical protein